jgi:hypothetical protein
METEGPEGQPPQSEKGIAEHDNERVRANRERYLYRPARRFFGCFERYNGAVTAAATVAIAALTISLSLDSSRQAETAHQQFTIMQGQLDEMKVQSAITRNQVRAYLTLSYGKSSERDGIFVTPTFRNTGESEATNFKGWMIGGFLPHQYQQTSTSLRDANTAPFQVELLVAGTRYSCQAHL